MFRSGAKRCLNCDAVLEGPVCEQCELTPAAASLVLRRKLILRTGVFMLGSLAFLAAADMFPPLEMDGMLIFCGVLFFLGLAIAVWVEHGALRGASIEIRKRLFMALVPIPWLLASLLFVNAKLDDSPVHDWETRVVGKFSMSAMVSTRRLVVVSWRDGHSYERVPVSQEEYSEFHIGEPVIVEVRSGLAGIPWVTGVIQPGSVTDSPRASGDAVSK